MSIGEKIVEARRTKNLTQEQLAELSNLTAKYISALERGKFSPSLSKIEAIANALEIEPYLLLKPDHLSSNDFGKMSGRIYKR